MDQGIDEAERRSRKSSQNSFHFLLVYSDEMPVRRILPPQEIRWV
ncbi:hypothetical protein HMPREF1508_0459 [Shuttleworthella sp. MSX8B]|nr:hypothetical protein HMPREF1508_0459 [Shuttleworthia sp. MSX8B]